MPENIALFKTPGEALAIGLLIGVERYKSRGLDERRSAGMRTFTVIALLGAICGLLDVPAFTLITFGALLVLLGPATVVCFIRIGVPTACSVDIVHAWRGDPPFSQVAERYEP